MEAVHIALQILQHGDALPGGLDGAQELLFVLVRLRQRAAAAFHLERQAALDVLKPCQPLHRVLQKSVRLCLLLLQVPRQGGVGRALALGGGKAFFCRLNRRRRARGRDL